MAPKHEAYKPTQVEHLANIITHGVSSNNHNYFLYSFQGRLKKALFKFVTKGGVHKLLNLIFMFLRPPLDALALHNGKIPPPTCVCYVIYEEP